MKKYCENRKCMTEICPNCGISFEKPKSELLRNWKRNRLSFCSISCATLYRLKTKELIEKEKDVRKNFIKNNTGLKGDLNPSHKRLDEYSIFRETLRKAKMHAKLSHKECTISLEDLKLLWEKQLGKCIYTNISLILPTHKVKPNLTEYASLDRIDSSKGYIPGNILFISSCINFLKHTLSDLEVKQFLKQISSFTSTFEEDLTISSSQHEMLDALAGN